LNAPLRAYEWTGQEWDQVAETARGTEGIVTISVMAFPPAAIWTGQQLIVGGEGALPSWDPSGRQFATRSDQRLRSLAGTPVWTGAKVVALSNQSVEGWVFTPGRT
ncbi:MAG: hypothetical protein M3471_08200, partial [Actinomycetota bacterium]|nr:hypothetical protein [Actinomycetota bacterium]